MHTNGDEEFHFFSSSDSPLTQVAAQLVARGGTQDDLEPFEDAAKRARRVVSRPFARADYRRYKRASDLLLWLDAFSRLVRKDASQDSEVAKVADRIIDSGRELPPPRLEERADVADPTGLLAFVSAVRTQAGGEPESGAGNRGGT